MPNITISGLPPATLPLDGPNSFFEVQTIEAGVPVSRRVASDDLTIGTGITVEDEGVPLAAAATTLDFVGAGVTASGVGSTKTITIPGASGAIVNPGTVEGQMLRWDNTGSDYDPFSELIADLIGFELVSQLTYVAEGGIAVRNANGDVFIDNNLLGGGQYQYSVNLGNDAIRIRDDGLALFGMSGGTQNTTLQSGAEVDIVRNGVDQIALSLAPAAGGLSVNNTLTGAGLERVLTLSDLASGGQVNTVVGGTNITVNAADPVNPIVNLDAAITGMTVNGVVLNTGGLATDYLNETGAYNSPTNGVVLTSGGVATNYLDETGAYSVPAGSGVTNPMTADLDGDGFDLDDMGVMFMRGQAAQEPDVAGQGQIWVEEGTAGDPLWLEVETLADMNGPDAATSYTEVSQNGFSMGFNGNAELDTAQFNSGTASLLLDGTGDWGSFADNAVHDMGTGSWTVEGFVRFNTLPPLQTSLGPGYVLWSQWGAAVGDQKLSYAIIQDGFGFRVRLAGAGGWAEVGTISGGILTNTWYHWAVTRDIGGDGNVRAYFNGIYEIADFGVADANMGRSSEGIRMGSLDGSVAFLDGWLDDVRETIGTARYAGTGSFTPPSTPYLMAPGEQGFNFVSDSGLQTDLLTGAASSLEATMAVGNTTTIDLQIITGAALTIFDAADVDSVSIEINTTTMAPAEALVFLASVNVEVYSFDEGINIDGGDLNLGTGSVNFYRFGDSVSSSLGPDGTDIRMQIVGGTSTFFVQADSIRLSEAATPAPNIAGRGQIWVRDDVPNNLAFTDDADEDFAVAYATGRETANATHDFNTAGNIAENFIGFYDDGAAYTVTLEDSTSVVNWPVHTAIQVLAPTVGAITVAEGAGTTLFLDDGTDTVGGGTLTQGVVTIYRTSTTDYYIWGSGFTP